MGCRLRVDVGPRHHKVELQVGYAIRRPRYELVSSNKISDIILKSHSSQSTTTEEVVAQSRIVIGGM